MFFSVSIAPFGVPVVPDVHIISAGCSLGSVYSGSSICTTSISPLLSVMIASGPISFSIFSQCALPYRYDSGTAVTPAAKHESRAIPAAISELQSIAQHSVPLNSFANPSAKITASSNVISALFSHIFLSRLFSILFLRKLHSIFFKLLFHFFDKLGQYHAFLCVQLNQFF